VGSSVHITYDVVAPQKVVFHVVTSGKYQESRGASNRGQAKDKYNRPLEFDLGGNIARKEDANNTECREWDVEENCVELIEPESL